MIAKCEFNTLLRKYDTFHCQMLDFKHIEMDINFYEKYASIVITLMAKDSVIERLNSDIVIDKSFETSIFPKIIFQFLTKNFSLSKRKVMTSEKKGMLFVNRTDGMESFTARNIPIIYIDLFEKIEKAVKTLREDDFTKLNISSDIYNDYTLSNIVLQYALYRRRFVGNLYFDNASYDFTKDTNVSDNNLTRELLILAVARCLYSSNFCQNGKYDLSVLDEIKSTTTNVMVKQICDSYKEVDYSKPSLLTDALICAEYEMNNEAVISKNSKRIQEALKFILSVTSNKIQKYVDYWQERKEFYKIVNDDEMIKICDDFLNCINIKQEKKNDEDGMEMIEAKEEKETIISRLKRIKEEDNNKFSNIINNPIKEDEASKEDESFAKFDDESLHKGAEEQAKMLMKAIEERDKIKKDAEEFAKIILKAQRERREIIRAAEEQAKKIVALELENEKLKAMALDTAKSILAKEKRETDEIKKLAMENAKDILARQRKYNEELRLREVLDNAPVNRSDIDKINNLLNALSSVKELDFAVNHPTVMQEVSLLEEKIVTYLTTHKNIVDKEKREEEIILTPSDEKTPTDLLAIIRNVYLKSRTYEKEGRHTVINIVPSYSKYRVTLYSVKNDSADVLTDVYFDSAYFTEGVIKEICDIYKTDSIIVASKTDNVPGELADYLVIDNKDNAIKFMGCNKLIVNIAKAYL